VTPHHHIGLDEFSYLPLDARIRMAAAGYLGWGYDSKRPAVAYPSGSVPAHLVGRGTDTDCCTFTTSILMACYPGALWTSREFGDLQSFGDRFDLGDDYHPRGDAPMAAVERVGVGHVTRHWMLSSWHLVQVWRSAKPPTGGGHSMLVYVDDEGLLVLEASPGVGPRWRRRTARELEDEYEIVHIARLSDG